MIVPCLTCFKEFNKASAQIKRTKNKNYCSKKCAAKANLPILALKRKKNLYCRLDSCKILLVKTQKKYCSFKCQQVFQTAFYVKEWKAGRRKGASNNGNISDVVRHYLFEKYNSKCCKCNWSEINPTSGKIPLEVDHIDGNWKNNKEENLQLICPNCHSLTSNYRGLNRGKGRHTHIVNQGLVVFTKSNKLKPKMSGKSISKSTTSGTIVGI